jgi:hypothetical protein
MQLFFLFPSPSFNFSPWVLINKMEEKGFTKEKRRGGSDGLKTLDENRYLVGVTDLNPSIILVKFSLFKFLKAYML